MDLKALFFLIFIHLHSKLIHSTIIGHSLLDRDLNQLNDMNVVTFLGQEQQQGTMVKACSHDGFNSRNASCTTLFKC